MAKIFHFIYLPILLKASLLMGNSQVDSQLLQLHLEVRNPNLGVFERIFYHVSIQNTSNLTLNVKPPWQYNSVYKGFAGKPLLEFKGKNDSTWKVLKNSARDGTDTEPLVIRPIRLPPNIKMNSGILNYIPVSQDSNKFTYYFNEGNSYQIRAKYPIFYLENGKKVELLLISNEVSINMVSYKDEDYEVFKWLNTLEIPHFVFLELREYYHTVRTFPRKLEKEMHKKVLLDSQYLIETYPKSKFAQWGKLFQAMYILSLHPNRSDDYQKSLRSAEAVVKTIETEEEELLRLKNAQLNSIKRYKDK